MRNNQPVTQREQRFRSGEDLVSVTDLDGKIRYVNDAFLAISGFTMTELVGQDHNIVRHPDMPKAAFEDLWKTIRSGTGWRGVVKNRCKNGDHYWVDAFVTPVAKKGKVIGYQSVRSEPSREQVQQAASLYAKLNGNESLKLPQPQLAKRLSFNHLFATLSITSLIALLAAIGIAWQSSNMPLVGVLAIPTLLVLLTWWKISSGLIHPLADIRSRLREMASGDYNQQVQLDTMDEIGRTMMAVKLLQARSKTVLGQVVGATRDLIVSADQLSATSYTMLHNMQKQASHTAQIATAMNEMSATVEEVSGNAQNASSSTTEARGTVVEGDKVVTDALSSMEAFSRELTETTQQINTLSADSEQISKITDVISEIAEQTNLLALNAAIEAARAGEQGRGFAVVADEVRNLASRTQNATQEIRTMLDNLSSGIKHSASTIETNNEGAQIALGKVTTSREIFAQVADGMDLINDMSVQIATAAEEQSLVSVEMSRNIETISEEASLTEQEATKLQDRASLINNNATHLQSLMSDFDLGGSKKEDFSKAKQAHIAWKTRARSYLNGEKDAITRDQACSHKHCEFGMWYSGQGQKKYGHMSTFKAIDPPHELLHKIITQILDANEAGEIDEAEKLYQHLEPASEKVVQLLDKLELEVNK